MVSDELGFVYNAVECSGGIQQRQRDRKWDAIVLMRCHEAKWAEVWQVFLQSMLFPGMEPTSNAFCRVSILSLSWESQFESHQKDDSHLLDSLIYLTWLKHLFQLKFWLAFRIKMSQIISSCPPILSWGLLPKSWRHRI